MSSHLDFILFFDFREGITTPLPHRAVQCLNEMIYGKHFEKVKVEYSVSERKVLHISFCPPALEQGRVKNSISITSYQ